MYTGFKPRWVVLKQLYGAGDNWRVFSDRMSRLIGANTTTVESTGNLHHPVLFYDQPRGEYSGGYAYAIQMLSNGFKIKANSGEVNASTRLSIYWAWAKEPLVTREGIPCTAK
jgi:hypothetical protein